MKHFLADISRTKFDLLCEQDQIDTLESYKTELLYFVEHSSGIEISRVLPSLLSNPITAKWFITLVADSALDIQRIQYSHNDYHPMTSISIIRGERLRGPRALLLTWLSTKKNFSGIQELTQGWIKDAKPHVFLNYILRANERSPDATFGHTMSFPSAPTNFSILHDQGPLALISNTISIQTRDLDTKQYAKTFGPHIGVQRFSRYIHEYWDSNPNPVDPCLLTTWLYMRREYKNEWTPTMLNLLRHAARKSPKEFVAICLLSLFDAKYHQVMKWPTLTEKQQRSLFSFMDQKHPWKNALSTASEIGIVDTILHKWSEHPWFKDYWTSSKVMTEYSIAEDMIQIVASYFPDTNMAQMSELELDFDTMM